MKHKCKICGKELNNLKFSFRHFKQKHNITLEEYLIKYNIDYKTKNQRKIEKQNNFKNNKEFVECKICGFKAQQLTSHITKIHKITIKEYKEKYKSEIYSNKLKNNLSEKNFGENNPFYRVHPEGFSYMTKKERKEKFGFQKENHPLWGKRHSKKTISKIKKSCCKSAKEYMKSLTKNERKEKFGLPGEKNPWFGKGAIYGSGRCKWYEYNGEKLQGSYELRFAKWLDKNDIRWEKLHKSLPYIKNNKKRTYLPDFKVYFEEKPVYIETKGYFDEECQIKMKLVRNQYSEEKFIVVDKKLLEQYENSIIEN